MHRTNLTGASAALALAACRSRRADLTHVPLLVERERDRGAQRLRRRAQGEAATRSPSSPCRTSSRAPAARSSALVVAGTPPNLFMTGNADFFRDIRDRGLGPDGRASSSTRSARPRTFPPRCARRSRSTARSARSRPASISTAWSTTTWRSPRRPASTRPLDLARRDVRRHGEGQGRRLHLHRHGRQHLPGRAT